MAVRSTVSIDKLEARLHEYEERYGVPSDRLTEAFTKSPIKETEDFHDWTLLYSAWQSITKRVQTA